ncbi:MAG: anthranilate phosphoribosyltransferase [Sulfolobaceae archaeon]
MSYKTILEKLINRQNLSVEESEEIAREIILGNLPETIVSAILVLLRAKRETSEEIVGFARALRNSMIRVILDKQAIDTAGTGGDGYNTINVSTVAALLLSKVIPVAKHGNRAVSGISGSADFLEGLGYNILVRPEVAKELINKCNFVFLYAPLYHPAMKNVANVRKQLGIKTIFNILGPLSNPAEVKVQMSGVFSLEYAEKISEAARELDYERLLIYHGEPGIDEVSPIGNTYIFEIRKKKVEKYLVNVKEFGIEPFPIQKVIVNSVEESIIRVLRASLGKDDEASKFICINTAIGLYSINKCKEFKDCYELCNILLSELINIIRNIINLNGDSNKLNNLLVKVNG